MSNQISPKVGIAAEFEPIRDRLVAILPKDISVDLFIGNAIISINKCEKIQKSTKESLFNVVCTAAGDGLLLDGKQAVIVPRWDKDKKTYEATYQIGWRGYTKLAWKSERVKAFSSQPFYDAEVKGGKIKIFHGDISRAVQHEAHLSSEDRGEMAGVYSYVLLDTGFTDVEVILKDDIKKLINMWKGTSPFSPWLQYPGEMARKFVIKRLAKRMPFAPELQKASDNEDLLFTDVSEDESEESAQITAERPKNLIEAALAPVSERILDEEHEIFERPNHYKIIGERSVSEPLPSEDDFKKYMAGISPEERRRWVDMNIHIIEGLPLYFSERLVSRIKELKA